MGSAIPGGATGNRLGGETSPYLLQHKDNPVHWRAWGEEALAEAKAQDKPILLSVGYAACHWCHVMAHESFENEATAALMNRLYVNIKVDREERPDLDHIYQQALNIMGEQGGWPLTMFLTPDGRPFWGGTYFPPESRWGRPGFREVLETIARIYADEKDKVEKNVEGLKGAMERLAKPKKGGLPGDGTNDEVARLLLNNVDFEWGGIAGAPKFPQIPVFELIWRAGLRGRDGRCKEAVLVTLSRMAQGGIYDHLGGGFARYSTDARWLVPHFEKMLYDNAEILSLMLMVFQETQEPLFEARIRETVEWLEREMLAEADAMGDRAFAASLDADSEGVEGRFYVWSESEIDALLGESASLFKRHYDVTADGNWEGHTILNRSTAPPAIEPQTEMSLAAARALLLKARETRIRPGWDDKVLADWNGLMIETLARAGRTLGQPRWIDLGRSAFQFIRRNLMAEGRLFHSWRQGQRRHAGTLDDHANMAAAALALFEATQDEHYLRAAKEFAELLHRHFGEEEGGYFMTAEDVHDVVVRQKTANDGATPNGNAVMARVLTQLYLLSGEDEFRQRADALVIAFSGEIERNVFPLATLLNSVDFMNHARQVVIVGEPDDPLTRDLAQAALTGSAHNRLVSVIGPSQSLPGNHPAFGKGLIDGRPTAYVCRQGVCGLPVGHAAGLKAALRLG
jgi:uncharacterized protein YyaL (SSP411 family)